VSATGTECCDSPAAAGVCPSAETRRPPDSIQGRARGEDLKEIQRRRAEYVQDNKTLIRGLESNPLA
jgi:hypothetical protein